MDEVPEDYSIQGNGTVIGDHSQSIVQSVVVDTDNIRHLSNRLDATTKEIASLSDRLSTQMGLPKRDWATYAVLLVFVVFCLAIVFSPLWLYPRFSSSSDVQNLILSISSAMSGVTGLLGVLIGNRTRLQRL